MPFPEAEGTRHAYDNPTTFILARMVERVTGRGLPELLDERLFRPMGVDHAEWDRVASGAAFGFHGLHLTTEAVAAFGELLLRRGLWGDRQLVPREWVELATRRHIDTLPFEDGSDDADFLCGYGYQFWMSRHGYHGHGSFGQLCVVVPSHDLVVAVTGATAQAQDDARRHVGVPAARRGPRGKRPGRRDPRRSAAAAVIRAGAGFGRPGAFASRRDSTPPPRIRLCPTEPR